MKRQCITIIAASILFPSVGFSQPPNPPNPPNPPAPPAQPATPEKPEKRPKVPVTFLGVETSRVPTVVCEQLALAKGFGLVVDYVVPDSPAAAAGLQQNDILKLLNDQILTEPDQLSKLIRSYSEGTNVTLTVLRKGQEQKITVKLSKKEVPQRRVDGGGRGFGGGDIDFDDLRDQMKELKNQLGDADHGMIHDAVMKAHEQVQRVREQAERAREQAQRVRDQAQQERERVRERAQEERERAREEAQEQREEVRRNGQQIRVTQAGEAGLKTTTIDLDKAQIVCSDDKGELRIDNVAGKKMLTAKDPKGMLLFSGPVETKEDVEKIPPAVRERFEKLQQNDLPSVIASNENDEDDNSADTDEEEDETPSAEQICISPQSLPSNFWAFRTILI
jgi:PDZ domain